jgi:uncharacterized secreted protein with C-terminal beta-propeller domain
MIYNLVEYISRKLPDLNIVTNGFDPDSKEDQVMVSETGGEPAHYYDRKDWTIQVLSRSASAVKARQNIGEVYLLLNNKFGVVLPRVVVDSVRYPRLTAWQISPIQTPAYLGATVENLELFSFNLTVTTT